MVGHSSMLKELTWLSKVISTVGIMDDMAEKFSSYNTPKLFVPNREVWIGSDKPFDSCSIFTDESRMEMRILLAIFRDAYRLPTECYVFQAKSLGIGKGTDLVAKYITKSPIVSIYINNQVAL